MDVEGIRQEIIEKVQKQADTEGTQINAAEVSRVASITLDAAIEAITNLLKRKEG